MAYDGRHGVDSEHIRMPNALGRYLDVQVVCRPSFFRSNGNMF